LSDRSIGQSLPGRDRRPGACSGGIRSYDGASFSDPVLPSSYFQGLWGTSATNLYAVGIASDFSTSIIYHYY
jgi:hypothetical protein